MRPRIQTPVPQKKKKRKEKDRKCIWVEFSKTP
jgi:hypothetical protein